MDSFKTTIDEIYQVYKNVKLKIQTFNLWYHDDANFTKHFGRLINSYFTNATLENKYHDNSSPVNHIYGDVVLNIGFIITMKLSTGEDLIFHIASSNLSKFINQDVSYFDRTYLFFIEKVQLNNNGHIKHICGTTITKIEDNILNSLKEWCFDTEDK